eukprot:TRINITY_DN32299_c0_g1_i1.p1 TRINITY_DN32299_c0_g1~~TRINITY_DN32299_c0_g1_i1.p1  ORF type:complete len:338 (-),score=70.40 TRINITY_DN32299_c0_g1_i1:316-1329(-)
MPSSAIQSQASSLWLQRAPVIGASRSFSRTPQPAGQAYIKARRPRFVVGTLAAAVGSIAVRTRRGQNARAATSSACQALPASLPAAPFGDVLIEPDADAVGAALCTEVAAAAKKAVAERGAFSLAIPGGSILKMLAAGQSQLRGVEWDKGALAYVNHRCVTNDDATATHKKSMDLFLSEWSGLEVVTLGGSAEGAQEAERYEAKLRELSDGKLPRSAEGFPVFDLVLIGVGDDGHFGSLYPGREEIADESGRWVLPVDMKSPPSITLSPGVMLAARDVIVASAGVSEKYPKGKSEAMRSAIEGDEGPSAFPAQVLRGKARWLLDAAAASALSPEYRQ